MTTYTDKQLEELWAELEDVLVYEDEKGYMYLQNDWFIFEAGTEREEIWHWFDERYSKGVYYLLYYLEY